MFPEWKNAQSGWSGETSKFLWVGMIGSRKVTLLFSANRSGLDLCEALTVTRNALRAEIMVFFGGFWNEFGLSWNFFKLLLGRCYDHVTKNLSEGSSYGKDY